MRERFYLIWHTGLANSEMTGTIFDLTYSSVSHSVKAVKSKMAKKDRLKDHLEDLNSQLKADFHSSVSDKLFVTDVCYILMAFLPLQNL